MKKNLLFVGIDVDDKAYHISVYDQLKDESVDFKSAPTPESLVKSLIKKDIDITNISVCYEASYIGYSIYRKLNKLGVNCEIAAPSLIPRQVGHAQKTDRIDANKIARFFAKGLLTLIYIPDETDESVRDLLRSRRFLSQSLTKIKNHITGMGRRYGFDYKQETGKCSRWTIHHLDWLAAKINKLTHPQAKFNFKIMLKQFHDISQNIDLYDVEIEHIALSKRYQKKTEALCCFKGVKANTALTLITELGDIRRFDHPKKITSYAGFDLVEYSSGGKQKRYGISKFGNTGIRRSAVDAVKFGLRSSVPGHDLRERRKKASPEIASIASKCATRIHKKGTRMLHNGKPIKKVQVACGREFLGFVWEALTKVS